MIKGIAASSGIAIGKAYKLFKPTLAVEKAFTTVENELAKLSQVMKCTKDDILTIQEKAKGRLSGDELAIFDAHLAVVDDPELEGQVKMLIEQQLPLAKAIENVRDQFVAMFEAMDNDYFKERAADIKDVTYRMMAHALDISLPNLSLIDEPVIVVAHDLTPSDTAQLDKQTALGFATEIGGRTSHSAIMARSLEIPAIVGLGDLLDKIEAGDLLILDAINGELIINPDEKTLSSYQQKQKEHLAYLESLKELKDKPSITKDGHQIKIAGNIGTPKDVAAVLANGGDAIGLYRTEFLYMDASALPDEEQQFEAYKTVIEQMNGKQVVIRTLDIGGDKELSYLKFPPEMNPFLGYRAIRLCLDRTDIFRVQLRALLRASAYGSLAIMFPMIATVDEFRAAKALLKEEKANLLAAGVQVGSDLEVGLMIEIPAAALNANALAKEADFFSIGTNDLIQYTMAADRMNQKVSYLYQPYNPSILRLIKLAIDGAHKEGKWCGMCGEMAGEQMALPILLGLGLDEFSMSASSILQARKLATSLSYQDMQVLAEKALACATADEVISLVKEVIG